MAAAKTLVDNAISGNKVVVFSKTSCPYCKRAKGLLQSEFPQVEVKIIEINGLDEMSQIQDYLKEKTGQRTVPSIFIDQKFIGGCSELVSLNSKGELETLLL